MRLSLDFPAPWSLKEAPDDQWIAVLPGAEGSPAAVVTYGPIIIRPDEFRPWMELTARSDIPLDTRVRLGQTMDHETRAGWPLRLLPAEVVTAKDELVEGRLCAFFLFMEHAAVAMVRVGERAAMEQHGKAVLHILEGGRPDWHGELLCLADLWDLEPRSQAQPRGAQPTHALDDDDVREEALRQADGALVVQGSPQNHLRRGSILLDQKSPAEALAAFRAALVLDAASEPAHYFAAVALGQLGRHEEAIAEWQAARMLNPQRADSAYNIAQAHFNLKQYEAALAEFQAACALEPADVLTLRKVIQCLYALERYDEGQAARSTFRARWAKSTDPRTRLIHEYVFDQFESDGFRIHAQETLRPRDPAFYTILTFRVVDAADRPLPVAVLVETSDQARQAGTPFVIGVRQAQKFKVVELAEQLPLYPALKQTVRGLITEALKGNDWQ